MRENDIRILETELSDFRTEVLADERVKKQIREMVVEEAKLANQIAKDEMIKQLGLGVGDILPKIDDMLQKLWDWWKKRKKGEGHNQP